MKEEEGRGWRERERKGTRYSDLNEADKQQLRDEFGDLEQRVDDTLQEPTVQLQSVQ